MWVNGMSLSDIGSEQVGLIEDVFMYRLVWALEAVRVPSTIPWMGTGRRNDRRGGGSVCRYRFAGLSHDAVGSWRPGVDERRLGRW